MRVGLVAYVPYETVARGVEYPVECDRQLDDTQSGTQWPPVTETASMVSNRNSSASWRRSLSGKRRKSSGVFMVSRRGVLLTA